VGPEPQANRRWAVREDGAVLCSANGEPFDFQALPRRPFNRPCDPDPIAVLAREDLAALMALLEEEKVFGLPPVVRGAGVRPPKDGMDRYVVARHRGREAQVRFRAGAPAGDRIAERFLRLVESRMPWEPGKETSRARVRAGDPGEPRPAGRRCRRRKSTGNRNAGR